PLLDEWMAELPLLGTALARAGGVRAAPATVRRLLARGAAVIACPESNHPKPFRDRYRLGRFGRGAFARVAIATGTPIVPVAVIGAEEVHPVLARLDLPGRLLGLPTLPLTPTFPWLGLWGLVPLPTKWALLFGEPLEVAARHAASDAADPARVGRLRDQVRERLQALGITNQRETTVLWERRSGRPVHRAIVWQDRRTAALCQELRARGLEDVFRQKTGLVLDPYFSGTKLRWLLEHVPRAAERARAGALAFGTIDTWLMWKLTGG